MRIAEDKDFEGALLRFRDSLSKSWDEIVEHYVTRLQNAKTEDEYAEALAGLMASGVITVRSIPGVSKMSVRAGKTIAKIPGKMPEQIAELESKIAKEVERLSEKWGHKKTGEFVAGLENGAACSSWN